MAKENAVGALKVLEKIPDIKAAIARARGPSAAVA